jgi:hypothetical protein
MKAATVRFRNWFSMKSLKASPTTTTGMVPMITYQASLASAVLSFLKPLENQALISRQMSLAK